MLINTHTQLWLAKSISRLYQLYRSITVIVVVISSGVTKGKTGSKPEIMVEVLMATNKTHKNTKTFHYITIW